MRLLRRRSRRPQRTEPPHWPDGRGGVRVLVEHSDPVIRDILERGLGDRGYEVLGCAGPRPDVDGAVSCPLLHQEHCPAIDGADIVVNGLRLETVITRMGLRRARTQRPELPFIVEAPEWVVEEHDGELTDAFLYPLTIGWLTRLIDELIAA